MTNELSAHRKKLAATNYWNELMVPARASAATALLDYRGGAALRPTAEEDPQGLGALVPASLPSPIRSSRRSRSTRRELPLAASAGQLKFQGGQVMFIVVGRGHTLDGVKHA